MSANDYEEGGHGKKLANITDLKEPFSSDEALAHYFKYHAPTPGDIGNYQAVNDAALRFAVILRRHVPAGADRNEALKLIRLARMMANAAIAIKA